MRTQIKKDHRVKYSIVSTNNKPQERREMINPAWLSHRKNCLDVAWERANGRGNQMEMIYFWGQGSG